MEAEAAPGWRWRWRLLWALCLPCCCCCLLWDPPAMAHEAAAAASTPLPTPALRCADFSGKTCEECTKNAACLWCSVKSTCMDYPVSQLIPTASTCLLKEARWGVCWLSLEAFIVTLSVILGVLLLGLVGCCCYCCCCCRKPFRGRRAEEEEEESFIRDREEKRLQSLQQKLERKVKHDKIRRKYGLLQDSDHPYSRYENE